MSTYMYGKLTVRGDAEILRDFVKYLENDYDDKNTSELIKRGEIGDYSVTKDYINENCYVLEGSGNYFFIDISEFSSLFPTLKFEYISECHDGCSESNYTVCLPGINDTEYGNSFTFRNEDEGRCILCNCELDYYADETCDDCVEFLEAIEE